MKILAIETSCDETAAAVIEVKKYGSNEVMKYKKNISILSNVIASQIKIHQKFGGIFPEMASRAHAEKIIPVISEALTNAQVKKYGSDEVMKYKNPDTNNFITYNSLLDGIDLIAVTTGPGLIGSLLVGVNAAKTLAYAYNKPIIGINHWLGHIYSNFIKVAESSKLKVKSKASALPQFPALILIVSGGHTGLVLMKSHCQIISLGETLDDAAGEAFDKVAKILNLGYPGGPAIAATAAKLKANPPKADQPMAGNSRVKNEIKLPRPMMDSKDYNFSFSGLKTAVLNESKKYPKLTKEIKIALAKEFQQAVVDTLIGKTIRAAYEFKPKSICLCGGVSANQELRAQMQKAVEKLPWRVSYHVPPIILSTDNAAMIGVAAVFQKKSQWTTFDKIKSDANLNKLI